MARLLFLLAVLFATGVYAGSDTFAANTSAFEDACCQCFDGGDTPAPEGLDDFSVSSAFEAPILGGKLPFLLASVASSDGQYSDHHPIRAPPCFPDNRL